MNQNLVNAYQALTRISNLLEESAQSVHYEDPALLQRDLEMCRRSAANAQQLLTQITSQYRGVFAIPQLPNTPADGKELEKYEQVFNNVRLRNLLLVPARGLFAKKPTQSDFSDFYTAASYLFEYYSQRQEMLEKYKDVLDLTASGNMDLIRQGLSSARENLSGSDSAWDRPIISGPTSKELYLGDLETPIQDVGNQALKTIGIVNERQGETWMDLPFSYNAQVPFSLFAGCEGSLEDGQKKMSNLIRSIMYQIMRALPRYTYQFIYLDPARGGASLKEINSKLYRAVDGNAFRLHERLYPDHMFRLLTVGSSNDETRELLKQLDERIGIVNSIRGSQTVAQFNAPQIDEDGKIRDGQAGVIPHVFVFYENTHQRIDQATADILAKLANSPACGVSLMMTSCRPKGEAFTKEELLLQSHDQLQCDDQGCSIYFDSRLVGQQGGQLFFNFLPNFEPIRHEAFLEKLCGSFQPDLNVETKYEKRVNIDAIWGSGSATDEITIPVGINDRNEVVNVALGGPSGSHALVAGSTGCGKTSFLHSLINGVIIHYKPTDVQIWLSDYKSAEFMRYISKNPPHITYVGVGRSVDYTFEFIDRIYNEYERRLKLFGSLTSVAEYRQAHGPDSLPRILVIVDEFHVMSDHCKEFPVYKKKLTSILKEARATGIAMLLSDQTCGVGLGGLSDEAKLQLTCRMAMSTTNDEYKDVFNISDPSVIPVQSNFEVTLERKRSIISERGAVENVRYYEHCKTLYISQEMRDQVADRSIADYGPAVNPLFVEEFTRTEADWQKLAEQKQHGMLQRTTPIYLGTPRSMQPYFSANLSINNNENIACLVPFEEVQASMLVNMLQSVLLQADSQVYIIANPNDFLFGYCESWLDNIAGRDNRVHIATELDEICTTVLDLSSELEARRRQRRFDSHIYVFWIDLYDISDDMSYLPAQRPAGYGAAAAAPAPAGFSSDLMAQLKSFDELFSDDGTGDPTPDPLAGFRPDSGDNASGDSNGSGEENEYNACEDIRRIIEQGPRRDIHHFMFYSAYSEVKQTRCAPLNCFTHKIALGIGKDDAYEFFGASRLMTTPEGEPLGDDIAVYYNGRTSTQFMPYISPLEVMIREQKGL